MTGVGDMFLGMNAHINRDLSYTLAAVGLVKPGGGTRKTDHDKVNTFLANVADPLQAELARRYDPLFDDHRHADPARRGDRARGGARVPRAGLAQRRALRQRARPGLPRLAAAARPRPSRRHTRTRSAPPTRIPGYGPTRDAYCRAHLEPSFQVDLLDSRIRPVVRRGSLELRVLTDGPARVTLSAALLPRAKKSARAAKKRKGRAFAQTVEFETNRAGEHIVALGLTKRGKRLLRKRRSARIAVALRAPGLSADGEGRLRRKRHRR